MNATIIWGKRLLALSVCLSALMFANAQKVTIDGLKYYLNADNHEAIVDNGNRWSGELIIPSEVNHNGDTFTVKSICWAAFYDCHELTKVRLPKTVEVIDNRVFTDDSESGGAVSPVYKNPFKGCSALDAIEVDEDNPSMCSIGGVLFSKDGTELYSYPAGKKAETYVVPQGVTWIGGAAFASNRNLFSVEMSAMVTRICSQAFEDCSSLRLLDLPESVRIIESLSFHECNLESLIIRGLLDSQSVGSSLFSGLSKSTVIYTLRSQIDSFANYFSGNIRSLEDYETVGMQTLLSTKGCYSLYNLQGRRIQNFAKGIYIRNGRKVVVK